MASTQIAPVTAYDRDGDPSRREIAALMSDAAAGDHAAWEEIVARHAQLVWSVTRRFRLDHSDAADVFQTVWLRLVEHIDELVEPCRVPSWLATTARRECARVVRADRRHVAMGDALPEPADTDPEIDARLVLAERDALLREAFLRLPRADQLLLGLLVREPAPTYDEIAAQLRMPRGSIGPTRRRCLDRLRAECDSLGERGWRDVDGSASCAR